MVKFYAFFQLAIPINTETNHLKNTAIMLNHFGLKIKMSVFKEKIILILIRKEIVFATLTRNLHLSITTISFLMFEYYTLLKVLEIYAK